jgi:diadenosine tetraphosphate (Ap4A) HIT family hydrolase
MGASMETAKKTCPFCAIAANEDTDVEVIYEGKEMLAFFPESPATPGHTLIIPRDHVTDFWNADLPLVEELSAVAVRIGRAIDAALKPEGMNLITSAGEVAEQTVFHLHLHLVPRWRDDELDIWPPKKGMEREVREDLGRSVRAVLGSG